MSLGLMSHERLIGKSALANGDEKHDYLCLTTMTLSGVQASLVVKVAPNQPNLLGLDAIVLFDMDMHPASKKYSIAQQPLDRSVIPYRWLHFENILKQLQITNKDLVPLQRLPPPDDSYKVLISAGKSHYVLDLGTAFSNLWVRPEAVPIVVDLGWSC